MQPQESGSLLSRISVQLEALVQSPGATAEQQELVAHIERAITRVQALLEGVRQDAKHLIRMTHCQLLQPSALVILDDLVKQARDAFIGQLDPTTGELADGVTPMHYAIEHLATMQVMMMPGSNALGGGAL